LKSPLKGKIILIKGFVLNSLLGKIEKYLYPLLGIVLLVFAYSSYEWQGVAFVISGGVMWALMHLLRTLQVLKKAANRPIGYVDSAVMLNAKLKKGMSLLHVIALTKSLGQQDATKGTENQEKEVFSWLDGSDSFVICEFENGKLRHFELTRPVQE